MTAGAAIELWAGVECTVNRVGDAWHDQLECSGHDARLDDVDRIAALGVRTLRFPLLWERTSPAAPGAYAWEWADTRMARLATLALRPIVGLVHHGSGPRYTSLLDPTFADLLASYAGAVARRYPWVRDWTPVNEPLTTARFSGLYGHWYPHGRDTPTFLRALLTQCRAVVLAMRAIRAVIPDARLVQTEDIGTVHATPRLAYQAEYENHRRWLSLDLLMGRVRRDHPLWTHLLAEGIAEWELAFFVEHPCPPDVIGINYYLTSDRLLDEQHERYPPADRGGNGRDRYADVEAVRAWGPGITGHRRLLRDVWDRYARAVAITEAHYGGTREEQLRWIAEAWCGALGARDDGCDVRAVTVWSLLGAYDWLSLVTRRDGIYESGAFDVRAAKPRATAVARLTRALATGGDWDHPVLDVPGWWHRSDRLLVSPAEPATPAGSCVAPPIARGAPRVVLITGARGTLGRAVARLCERRGLPHRLVGRREMDIADGHAVACVLDAVRPWAVVNAAGYVRVDDAEREPDRCHRENAIGPVALATACAERGIRFVTFSSDLVFDGTRCEPYLESHPVGPLSTYGRTKAIAEAHVQAVLPEALVIRTSAFFGPWDRYNFVTAALGALAEGHAFRAAADAVISPTYVPDLVHASLDLLIDGESGLWHVSNDGAVTWAELARVAARLAAMDAGLVEECETAALALPARRPLYSVLRSERADLLGPLDRALASYIRDRAVDAGAAWWPGR